MKQLGYLTVLTSLLTSLLGSSISFSDTFSGFIEKSKSSNFIIKNSSKLELKFADKQMAQVLLKLNNQDYISVDGSISAYGSQLAAAPTLNVTSINYVGLHELIGFWKDDSGLCYYFIGFTEIKVFIPGPKLKCHPRSQIAIGEAKMTNYNYFINPDEDVWNMLISNEKIQYLAELISISSTKKKLVMYDAVDGKKLSEVTLVKVKP